MLSEIALDQWSVTVENIEKRVGRYEKKAELKRLYKLKSKDFSDFLEEDSLIENSRSESYVNVRKAQNPGIRFPQMIKEHNAESDTDSDNLPENQTNEQINEYHFR